MLSNESAPECVASAGKQSDTMLEVAIQIANSAEMQAGRAEIIAQELAGPRPTGKLCGEKDSPEPIGTYNRVNAAHARINNSIGRIAAALDRIDS